MTVFYVRRTGSFAGDSVALLEALRRKHPDRVFGVEYRQLDDERSVYAFLTLGGPEPQWSYEVGPRNLPA